MKPLIAVVLAAGAQTRMWPVVKNKITYPFLDKPFISYSVYDSLPKAVDRIVVISSRENRQAIESIPAPVSRTVVIQDEPTGMGGALLSAKEALTDAELLIYLTDHYVDGSLFSAVIRKGAAGGVFGVIPGWKTADYFPGGYLELEGTSVRAIREKPGPDNRPSNYVNVSGHYIKDSNELMAELEKTSSDRDDIYEKALTGLLKRHTFVMEPYEGVSLALKYPWDILALNEYFLSTVKPHVGKSVTIAKTAIIDGPVHVSDGVKICDYAVVKGPAYLGSSSIIGNNCLIRNSYVGQSSVIGFNSEVTRSYIGDACWFHSNYVGDSVLDSDVGMGAGAVTANFRLDENTIRSRVKDSLMDTNRIKLGTVVGQHVRIGVHASIMPGVKIGSGSFIGSGTVVEADVPVGSFLKQERHPILVKNTVDISRKSREHLKVKL